MNYEIAFWIASFIAVLFFVLLVWTAKRSIKTQQYNRRLFIETLTSHKVRDEALAELEKQKK